MHWNLLSSAGHLLRTCYPPHLAGAGLFWHNDCTFGPLPWQPGCGWTETSCGAWWLRRGGHTSEDSAQNKPRLSGKMCKDWFTMLRVGSTVASWRLIFFSILFCSKKAGVHTLGCIWSCSWNSLTGEHLWKERTTSSVTYPTMWHWLRRSSTQWKPPAKKQASTDQPSGQSRKWSS